MDLLHIMTLIGSVAMLMYGMKVMSEGVQKMAGASLRNVLGTMTTNRFTGLLTGSFITAAIQSSTATTVMTVSFVSAGLLSLAQAISVIMGANIGTTFTAWIMVLSGGFDMRIVVYAAIFIAIVLIYSKKNINMGEFIMGLALMLLGLTTLKLNAAEMELDKNMTIMDFFNDTSGWGYGSYLLYLLVGGLLTCCVQSSAAIMAITMTLCSTGVLKIDMGIALVMGENIGTTITSNVVALSATTQARRAAMAHLIFNLFGVCWILCIFPYFVDFICSLVGVDPDSPTLDKQRLSTVLAAFHTTFNVANVLILIWFIKPMEKVVCMIIPNSGINGEEEESRLRYISGGLLSTSELSILEAQKEIGLFSARCLKMFGFCRELLHTEKDDEFNKLFSRIEKYESITDNMEIEIANYLNKVSEGRLSADSKGHIQRMLREVSELESIGDSCFNLARTMNRRRSYAQEDFTESQYAHIHNMLNLTENALDQMHKVVSKAGQHVDYNISYNIEHEINNYRTQLKNQNLIDINNKVYDYQIGVFYIDLISECEKLGDYVVNVVQATKERRDIPSEN